MQNDATNATLKQFFYSYDPAANRTSEQIDTAVTSGTYNSLNQLTSRQAGGKIRFQGTLNEPGTVTVGGQPAWMQGGTNFVADVGLTSGTNSVPVVAKDANNNTRTNTYQVIVPGGTGKTISYDAAGNTTSDGTHTFTWDAASRLVKITYADSATSEFGYDAFGRRIRITEKDTSGTATSTKQFLWDGLAIAEERDASNSVTARYFEQGFQRIQVSPSLTQNYFTSRDHLGSIREVVDNTGTLVTRYSYDPFGRNTKSSGTVDSDMLYTGHYYHEKSSLSLAPYRAYVAELGRWLSRDPIGEAGGINLYGYVSNNPMNFWDPLGLDVWHINDRKAVGNVPGGPYGHSAAIVGQPGGSLFTYHSFDPNGVAKYTFESLADAMQYAAKKGYDRYSQHQSCDEGDNSAREKAKEWEDDKYHPTCHNCQNMVNEMMEAAGVPWVGRSWPNVTFRENAKGARSEGKPSDF